MKLFNFFNLKIFFLSLVLIGFGVVIYYIFFYEPNLIVIAKPKKGPPGMIWISGGPFLMGSNSRLANRNERPAHRVKLDGFWIDKTDVTNAQFAEFVKATGYVTTAEQRPSWKVIQAQLPPGAPEASPDKMIPGAMVFVGSAYPVPLNDASRWWRFVPGANWRHPQGPQSDIIGKENHPVVQVSYEDALAYAKWKGKRLPTEAEWEYAARGGLEQANYSWGDEFKPQGKRMANTFTGKNFPVVEPQYANKISTTNVYAYPPNNYGLYDMAGNVWQWVADWYRADAFAQQAVIEVKNPKGPMSSFDPSDLYAPLDAPKRVIRGGSFLCDEHFCSSYRPSARRGVDPYNPMSHIGFRLVATPKMAEKIMATSNYSP